MVRSGLTSPWIPDGWGWGGLVSDHCPVWIELYTHADLDSTGVSHNPSSSTYQGNTVHLS